MFGGLPHHVTQRGGRKQTVFFSDDDRLLYKSLLRHYAQQLQVGILGYCLMTNHVHHIVVASSKGSLGELFKAVHANYARSVNRREGWTGHLWQARFFSSALDRPHLLTAMRYVELNPVRASMTLSAEDYPWSSARARISNDEDPLLDWDNSWLKRVPSGDAWRRFLGEEDDPDDIARLRRSAKQNLPFVSEETLAELEAKAGTTLRYRAPGRAVQIAPSGDIIGSGLQHLLPSAP